MSLPCHIQTTRGTSVPTRVCTHLLISSHPREHALHPAGPCAGSFRPSSWPRRLWPLLLQAVVPPSPAFVYQGIAVAFTSSSEGFRSSARARGHRPFLSGVVPGASGGLGPHAEPSSAAADSLVITLELLQRPRQQSLVRMGLPVGKIRAGGGGPGSAVGGSIMSRGARGKGVVGGIAFAVPEVCRRGHGVCAGARPSSHVGFALFLPFFVCLFGCGLIPRWRGGK